MFTKKYLQILKISPVADWIFTNFISKFRELFDFYCIILIFKAFLHQNPIAMLKKSLLLLAGIFIISAIMASETRLLRQPAVNENHIAFAYGGNIWITGLYGGEAKRLTSFHGVESNPKFSPDGQWIAFSGQFAGSTDVYVVSVDGSEMKRLTWHPVDNHE